jgi:hypothetical protein
MPTHFGYCSGCCQQIVVLDEAKDRIVARNIVEIIFRERYRGTGIARWSGVVAARAMALMMMSRPSEPFHRLGRWFTKKRPSFVVPSSPWIPPFKASRATCRAYVGLLAGVGPVRSAGL